MNTETKTQPLYKILNEQRTLGEWKITNSKDYIYINSHGHVVSFPLKGIRGNFDIGDNEVKANAQYTALAVNNLHHLAEALEKAIAYEEGIYDYNKSSADWFNNNTPGVGQTIDYQSYPALPEWVKEAKEALKRIS